MIEIGASLARSGYRHGLVNDAASTQLRSQQQSYHSQEGDFEAPEGNDEEGNVGDDSRRSLTPGKIMSPKTKMTGGFRIMFEKSVIFFCCWKIKETYSYLQIVFKYAIICLSSLELFISNCVCISSEKKVII